MHRADAGGVNHAYAIHEARRREHHVRFPHAPDVLWITTLGDEFGEFVERYGLGVTIIENEASGCVHPKLQHGHDRGQRNHPGRQKIPAEKGVDQGALSTFEFADDHEIEAAVEEPGGQHIPCAYIDG